MATARLRERLTYQPDPANEKDWPAIDYRVDHLSGVPEGGNGYHDITLWIGDSEVRLDMPDGWATDVYLDGEESDEGEIEDLLDGGCVSDLETSLIGDYLKQIGEESDTIDRYWGLEGVEAHDGALRETDND